MKRLALFTAISVFLITGCAFATTINVVNYTSSTLLLVGHHFYQISGEQALPPSMPAAASVDAPTVTAIQLAFNDCTWTNCTKANDQGFANYTVSCNNGNDFDTVQIHAGMAQSGKYIPIVNASLQSSGKCVYIEPGAGYGLDVRKNPTVTINIKPVKK